MSIYQRLGSIYQNENEKTDSKILRNINIKQTFFLWFIISGNFYEIVNFSSKNKYVISQ